MILLVEDEPVVRQKMASALRDLSSEVIAAEDGLVAVQALQTASVDVILCDIDLPHLSGLALYETLPPALQRRFIFYSGRLPKNLPSGVPFFRKPVDMRGLLAEIQAVAQKSAR